MSFDGTTSNLFQWVAEMTITREKALADLLIRYEHQLEAEEQAPDRALLDAAAQLLQERLHVHAVDEELAHLGHAVYHHLCQWEQVRDLLSRYRAQHLPLYEEAWAWWNIVDCLALERQAASVIEQQQALLQWATHSLPLEQCLFTLSDTTQAFCWSLLEQQEQWFGLFEDLMAHVPATARNREDRFLTIRTACNLALHTCNTEKASSLVPSLYALLQEDQSWEQRDDLLLETQALHIELLGTLGQQEQLRQKGEEARAHLQFWVKRIDRPSLAQKRQIRRLCHNIAASLYETRHYDLAIPLFQQVVAYGATTPQTWLWLAASLWMVTHDTSHTLLLLSKARQLDPGDALVRQMWALPELQELHDDAGFLEVVRADVHRPPRPSIAD